MSIFLGDKQVTNAYLGGVQIVEATLAPLPVPTGGLIHYFNANIEATTTSWGDSISGLTPATINNVTVKYDLNTPSSSYYDFLGVYTVPQSYEIYFGQAPLLSGEDRTVLLWINPKKYSETAQSLSVMGKSNTSPSVSNVVEFAIVNGKLAYRDGTESPNFTPYQSGSLSDVELNEWQQVAFTFVSSSQTVTIYKNTESTTFNASCTYESVLPFNYWLVGDDANKSIYSGSVANQLIYDRAITAEEIQTNYDYFSQFYS